MDIINAVGRRKTSVARIYLASGKGEITINKKPLQAYFPSEAVSTLVIQPLHQLELANHYDIRVNVTGGGFKGQAEATRLAIARALCQLDPEYRPSLKKEGLLRRDPRMVERKKYGRRKARRRFQFSKR